MKIKSNSGVRGGAKIALPSVPIIEEPVINEVEGIEEVDDEEDISEDGGVG